MTHNDLIRLHDQAAQVMQEYWDKGEENERYIRAEHWDEAQKAAHEAQNRQAYSIGLIGNKVNQVLAYQRRNRVEYDIEAASDPNDEVKAALAKIQFRELEQRCNLKYVDSDVFQSGAGVLFGGWEIYLDKDDDLNIVPAVRSIDYKNLIFDPNAKTPEKNDALFMAKKKLLYRYQLRDEYGKEAAEVSASDDLRWGREANAYYGVMDENRDLDLITVFTHYQKVIRTYYVVLFNDYMNLHGLKDKKVVFETRDKEEAEQKLRELKIPYLANGYPIGANEIQKVRKKKIDKYVFTLERILEHEETDMEDFPISLFFGYSYMDKFWTLTDILKSAQRFVDRYISQIDYSFGKDIKNAYELVVPKLAEGLNFEQALKVLEDDGILPVKAEGAIKNVRTNGVNPQWMQMVSVMQSYIEDLAGGRSFQGLSEGANESGRAVLAKQKMGELGASLLIDNFIRAKYDLGRKLLWFFKQYDTSERIVKIGGSALTPEELQMLRVQGVVMEGTRPYVRINPGDTTHLANAKLELRVTVDELSETEREKKLMKLIAFAQLNPQIAQLPEFNELLMKYSDINYNDRMRLLEGYRNMLRAQAQAAQNQQNAELEKQAFDMNKERAKILLELNKLEQSDSKGG